MISPTARSRSRPTFRHNGALYPGCVINRVQVLFAEIRGYCDYGVSGLELRSQLLHGSQDCPGAAPDEQVMIPNERKTSFNRSFFVYCYDFVRIGEVRELRSKS